MFLIEALKFKNPTNVDFGTKTQGTANVLANLRISIFGPAFVLDDLSWGHLHNKVA